MIVGRRRSDDCSCGCERVVGIVGFVVARHPAAGFVIASFKRPCPYGGKHLHIYRVAYTPDQVKEAARG